MKNRDTPPTRIKQMEDGRRGKYLIASQQQMYAGTSTAPEMKQLI